MKHIKIKNFLPLMFLILLMLVPVMANAAIIPCGGWNVDEEGNRISEQEPCDFEYFIQLINNIIDWIIKISVPVATGVIAWAGFVYMTTAVSDKKSEAKGMLKKVFIGFAVILSAWIIVHTLLGALLSDDFQDLPVQVGLSNLINTYV